MFEDVVAAMVGLRAVDVHGLSDDELRDAQVEVQRQLASMQATAARLAAELDARQAYVDDGARSAPAWLAWQCHLPVASAQRRVRLGRALRDLPVTEAAWVDGSIDESHVAVLAGVRTERTAAALARDEELLVGYACHLFFRQFVRAVRYWADHVDPDGAESAAERQRASRRLHHSRSLDGQWFGDYVLDPVGGAIVDGELQRRCDELWLQDWKEAEARLGRKPLPTELCRTPAQRRADALVEMAVRSATAPAGGRRPAPLISVLVGADTVARLCELADGTVLTPGSVAGRIDDAMIEAVVFNGPGRSTDISHQRCFTGALRRIIELRDRHCYHPTCEEPASRCQVDHIVPYEAGGSTTEANGRLACGHHNRLRHQQGREPPDRAP